MMNKAKLGSSVVLHHMAKSRYRC